MRKAALAVIIGLFVPALSDATVTAVKTRPAGSNRAVQFNDNGVFGSSGTLTYNKATDNLTVSTVTASSETVSGPLRIYNATSGTYSIETAINGFGPEGVTKQVKTVAGFGSGGKYRIAVSSQDALPTTQQPGQTEVIIHAPNSASDGQVLFYTNGVEDAIFGYNEIDLAADTVIQNNAKLKLFNGGKYVTFKGSATQTDDINYTLPDSTGSVGQSLSIAKIYGDHVDLDWETGAGGTGGTSVYPATDTASFPYGLSVSTITGTDNWSTSGSIVSDGTIGSNSGNINLHGSTVTFDQPPTNTTDLIPVLNNLTVSWSTAVTDGAQLGSTETFSGYQTFVSSKGAAITYGLSVGSVTITGLPGAGPLYADASGHVSTTTASSGSGSSPFTQAVSTTNLSMGGHNLTNLGAEGWSVQPSTWLYLTDTGGQALTIGSTVTLDGMSCELVANSTYVFTAHVRVHGGGSATGGVTFQIHGPSGAFVHWMAGGPNNGSTTARFDQGADAIDTNNAQVLSNYNSQAFNDDEITGVINTGSTGGTMYLAVVPHNSASTITIEYGTNMVVTRASP